MPIINSFDDCVMTSCYFKPPSASAPDGNWQQMRLNSYF